MSFRSAWQGTGLGLILLLGCMVPPGTGALTGMALAQQTADEAATSPLIQAITDGDLARFEQLLATGAEIEQRAYAQTPLIFAAASGQVQMVRHLLSKGAETDSHAEESHALPALHRAAQEGHLAVVKALLAHGASIDFVSNKGSTALWEAVKHGQYAVVRELLTRGANAHDQKLQLSGMVKPLMIEAVQQSDTRILKALVQAGADIHQPYNGWTPLMYAAVSGQAEAVRYLLSQGLSANDTTPAGWTPLMAAAAGGQLEILQLLATQGAEIQGRPGWKALLQSVFSRLSVTQIRKEETVRWLLARGARYDAGVPVPDHPGYSEWLVAVASNVTEWGLELLQAGANPDQKSPDGWTALMWAACNNNLALTEALLARSTRTLNARNSEHLTALDLALGNASDTLVQTLLNAGAALNEAAQSTQPSLFRALEKESHLKLLIARGVQLNIRNDRGQTPLIRAADQIMPSAIRPLLAAGADRNLRDHSGKSALDYALTHNHSLLICLLMQDAPPDIAETIYRRAGITGPAAELAAYQKGYKTTPSFAEYLALADRHAAKGRFNSTAKAYQWARQHPEAKTPDNQHTLTLRLGLLALLTWRFDEAAASARQALQLKPEHIPAHLLEIHVRLCSGQQTEARQQYEKLLADLPSVLHPTVQAQLQTDFEMLTRYGLLPEDTAFNSLLKEPDTASD
ncbi:MAG: ankyrin repeat domain-containing protein [Candidatus Sericytochromatia bacterium]|nr:ankyrin repeat domain-containing protein [Candidatus Sericytochromatia bacterium]